jgi:ribonuclease HII
VVAAAVILSPDRPEQLLRLRDVRDSKQLTPARREALEEVIRETVLTFGIGVVPPAEIDAQGIVPATSRAMTLALQDLSPPADYLLIDHLSLPTLSVPQKSISKGDAHVLSIAAASILAKVNRDRLMVAFEEQFPGYGFARHKGYGTSQHQVALTTLGASGIHRLSFAPLQRLASACA